MNEDDPDDVVHTKLWEALFPDHPSAGRCSATEHTVGAMSRDDIVGFHSEWYRAANLVVAAAGDLDHDDVVAAVEARFAERRRGGRTAAVGSHRRTPRPGGRHPPHRAGPPRHRLAGAPPRRRRPLRARRRQPRARRRRCRAACSRRSARSAASRTRCARRRRRYSDCGATGDLRRDGTQPRRRGARPHPSRSSPTSSTHGVTDEEHRVALGYLEGSMLLGLEDSGARMARLGPSELIRGFVTPVDEHVARIRAVTPDDVPRGAAPGVRRSAGNASARWSDRSTADDPVLA